MAISSKEYKAGDPLHSLKAEDINGLKKIVRGLCVDPRCGTIIKDPNDEKWTIVIYPLRMRPKKYYFAGKKRDISAITKRWLKVPFDGTAHSAHDKEPERSDEYEVWDLESTYGDFHMERR